MTGRREGLKLELVFETPESTPFLSSSLYLSSRRKNKVEGASSDVAYIGDRAGNFQPLRAASTHMLFSCDRQTVGSKVLSSVPSVLAGGTVPFMGKLLKRFFMQSDQQNMRVSSSQISPSPLRSNFLLTFPLKSHVPSALRNNQSYWF